MNRTSTVLISFLLFLFGFFNWSCNCEVRVRLYDEWQDPIEYIETEQELFDLIPRKRRRNDDSKTVQKSNAKGSELTTLMFIYEDECDEGLTNPFFAGVLYQTGPGTIQVAALNKKVYPNIEQEWNLASNCSHFLFIPVFSHFSDYHKFNILNDQSMPRFSRWINENSRIVVPFHNDCDFDIDFYWYDKSETFLATLKPGQERTEHTFLGHAFLARQHGTGRIIDAYLVENTNAVHVRERDHFCEDSGITDEEECNKAIEKDIIDWTYTFWARKREALNFVQPKILPNFSKMGFARSRLPDNIYETIFNFWQSHNSSEQLMTEHYAGPVMNQYTSPTFMAHLAQKERELLIDYFAKVLSEWVGLKPHDLDMTSLYGIRKYTSKAILGMHVDTCRTHVISAIINVDSVLTPGGDDWPLQIYDHKDKLHSFTMKPGDVVYYESAKCGHARFEPLDGEWYANIFIHFAPKDHGIWDCSWF